MNLITSKFFSTHRRNKVLTSSLIILAIVAGHFTGEKLLLAEDNSKDETANIAKPGKVKKVGNMEFVYIHGGSFMMGSNDDSDNMKPVHKVSLDGFWIGKYEVTQAQYEEIMGENPSEFIGMDNPVEGVSWDNAMKFCKKFSKKYQVKARLPYEAEWEYACRAGSKTKYYWGDTIDGSYLWYKDNSEKTTQPVGKKKPNAFGLYDMIGNIYEWCMDWFDDGYYKKSPAKNPHGPSKGNKRILRGGSWQTTDNLLGPANRAGDRQSVEYSIIGFRVVLSAK